MIGNSLISAALLFAPPAAMSVTTFGTSHAASCYQAAESEDLGGIADCDHALKEERLTRYETVATHVNRGILRLRNGASDSALVDFDAAIALDPSHPEAYLNKGGAILRQSGGAKAALPLFTAALDKGTREPAIAYFGRGLAQEQLGRIKEAYFDYKKASEIDPQWDRPRIELARFSVKRN